MGNEWTQERRRKQAEMIRQTKPWEKSTGPKSQKGKKISSLNARKDGKRSDEMKEVKKALRANKEFLKAFRTYFLAQHELNKLKRTN